MEAHVRDSVKAAIVPWLDHWEGLPHDGDGYYPYADSKGIFTVGVGFASLSPADAMRFPWLISGRVARSSEVANSYSRIMLEGGNRPASHYAPLTPLRLSEASVSSLLAAEIVVFEKRAQAKFPGYAGWPAPCQLAMMDMAWNIGPNFADGYPHFVAAMNAGDFAAAAKESSSGGTPSDRLSARSALLIFAAAHSSPGFDPDLVPWSAP